jgi:hypothetical protein
VARARVTAAAVREGRAGGDADAAVSRAVGELRLVIVAV